MNVWLMVDWRACMDQRINVSPISVHVRHGMSSASLFLLTSISIPIEHLKWGKGEGGRGSMWKILLFFQLTMKWEKRTVDDELEEWTVTSSWLECVRSGDWFYFWSQNLLDHWVGAWTENGSRFELCHLMGEREGSQSFNIIQSFFQFLCAIEMVGWHFWVFKEGR